MGTRSLTHVYQEDSETILCTIYRQFDGYPEGHGKELVEFVKTGELVNGIPNYKGKYFNGMGCFAAALIAHLKTEPGGIYMHPSGEAQWDAEFTYFIRARNGVIEVSFIEDEGDVPVLVEQWLKDHPEAE